MSRTKRRKIDMDPVFVGKKAAQWLSCSITELICSTPDTPGNALAALGAMDQKSMEHNTWNYFAWLSMFLAEVGAPIRRGHEWAKWSYEHRKESQAIKWSKVQRWIRTGKKRPF